MICKLWTQDGACGVMGIGDECDCSMCRVIDIFPEFWIVFIIGGAAFMIGDTLNGVLR